MKTKKSQKISCTGDCTSCGKVTCHLYNPYPCYGINCLRCESPCDLQDAGINAIKEKQMENQRIHNPHHEIEFNDHMAVDLSEQNMESISFARKIQRETARKIAEMYFTSPRTFDVTMREIYLGENQTAFAKQAGISRQAISKAIKQEKQEKYRHEIDQLKKQKNVLLKMNATELKIYQLCGNDGIFNISNVAKQAGVSRPTVYKTLHNLSEKYGICFTLDKGAKKKK